MDGHWQAEEWDFEPEFWAEAAEDDERAAVIAATAQVPLTYDQVRRAMRAYYKVPPAGMSRDHVLEDFCFAEGLEPIETAVIAVQYRAARIADARAAGVLDPAALDALADEPVTADNYRTPRREDPEHVARFIG